MNERKTRESAGRKKIFLLFAMLFITAFAVSACARQPQEPVTFDPALETAGPTVLTNEETQSPEGESGTGGESDGVDTPDNIEPLENAGEPGGEATISPEITELPPIDNGGETVSYAPTQSETTDDSIPYKRFSDTRLGIASHAPAEWKKADGETSVTFTMDMPTFAPRIMVMVMNLSESENQNSLKELASKASANLNSKYAGFKLADETESVLLEQASLEYTFSGTYNDNVSMKGRLAFTSRDGKLYIIQYVTAEADFTAYENVFRRMREKLVIE